LATYCKQYIKKYYEHFKFFRPECMDKRIREIMMRKQMCPECSGIQRCRMHPEFWFEGLEDRMAENSKLLKEFPEQGDISYLPEDIIEDTGVIDIKEGIPEIERRLGI
jgi:hypothetical protein